MLQAYNLSGAIRLLEISYLHAKPDLAISFDSSPELPTPRLSLERRGVHEEFFSSLAAVVRGPAAPQNFQGVLYFQNCWIEGKFPRSAFVAAVALQAILIAFPPPIWSIRPARTVSATSSTEITWYGPEKDLPMILPPMRAPRPTARREATKTQAHRGADAFHPGQTILSEPLHPTHPRQDLIQPKTSPEPPKILPALPNIVQLEAAQPERPRLQLTAKELVSLRPKTRAPLSASNIAAPEISAQEKQAGAINIASAPQAPPRPILPINPMSAPQAARQRTVTNVAAPDITGGTDAGATLIALSAVPAPAAPPPVIPAGNLSAHVSISPDGPQPGAPGGTAVGTATAVDHATGNGGHGPEGIFVSGGDGATASPISGLGVGPAARGANYPLSSRPVPRPRIPPEGSSVSPLEGLAASAKLGISPEKVLGSKRVYTLHVNMPNLTSASGSWILNFAELKEPNLGGENAAVASDLAGPVPLRKVDPKYPPELRASHVDGEVILYAIIRKDGRVDSIQLVHSVDPRLDSNAMEALAQWKFQAAENHGEPVDLEAVVYIPFRSRGPAF
jgi:TonB family protein